MEKKTCFIIMPSGRHNEYGHGHVESDFVFKKIIVPSVKKAFSDQVTIIREADRRLPGAITKEIVKNTITADLAIVDITGQNPNVFFELGIRFSLRRNSTILLRQEGTDIPFDIAAYRCVTYDPHFHNDETSREDLYEAIISAIPDRAGRSDSLVFDVFPDLYVEIPGVLRTETSIGSQSTMMWSDYWRQLMNVIDAIRDQFKNGRYVPSVIVGISNGGMMYADLLSRELFQGVPIVTLWANRWNKDAVYFEGDINAATIEGIRKTAGEGKCEMLLVDDIVASGYTIRQALNYLTQHLRNASISFLPLFLKNEKYFDNIKDHLLWYKEQFRLSEEDARQMHRTDAQKLPYNKDIRSS